MHLFSKGDFPFTLEAPHNLNTSQYILIFLFIRFGQSQYKQHCKCEMSAVQNRERSVALYVTAVQNRERSVALYLTAVQNRERSVALYVTAPFF